MIYRFKSAVSARVNTIYSTVERLFWEHFEKISDFFKALALQFVSYINLCINMRAIAHEQYLVAGTTASLAALLAYTIVRIVSHEEKGHVALFGMIVGGFAADIVGIWLTRSWQ